MDSVDTISLLSLVVNITKAYPTQSLLILGPGPSTFDGGDLIPSFARTTGIPLIALTYEAPINIRDNFNSELLTIVDLRLNHYMDDLQNLAEVLHFVRQTRTLLVLDERRPNDDDLLQIFTTCWENKITNAIAIGRDFWKDHQFYGFSPYPFVHLEKKHSPSDVIFPDRMANLQGSAIRTLADQIEPRNMLRLKPNGDVEVFGYVGRVMSAFVEKHNARLVYPIPFAIGKSTYYAGLRMFVFNGTLDLLISITIMNVSCEMYSYTLEQNSYCLMLPVEANIPTFEFFVVIMDLPVLGLTCGACLIISFLLVVVSFQIDRRKVIRIVDILLNVDCIRGLLSQSFNVLKSSSSVLMLIYFLISILGMYFTTWYLAYLQTYLTHPPRERTIRTYKDIRDIGFKILVYEKEYTQIYDILVEEVKYDIMKVSYVYSEFEKAMNTMNASYGYYIPSSKWTVLKGQQRLFSKPLVRLSDMCVLSHSQMAFALHEDSIYRTVLNRLILQVQEGGLLKHWMDRSFYELVEIGRMNFSDWTSSDEGYKQLRAKDLWWVLVVFLLAHCVNCLVFAGELVAGK